MRRRRALVAAGLAVAVAALATSGIGGRAWRTAYPYLPPRLQAVPYRLRALVRRPVTPVALPPPSAPGAPPATATAAPVRRTDAATPGASVSPTTAAGVPPPAAGSPTASPRPTVGAASLAGVRHAYQTWNNCGPATISMALSVLGLDEGQAKAARRLKPDPDDKNVSLDELARYAAERGAGTTLRYGGRVDTLATLAAAGYPVIVETWFEPEPGDEMGHYRLVTGFDAARRALTMADSYLGPAITEPYERFDADWRAFRPRAAGRASARARGGRRGHRRRRRGGDVVRGGRDGNGRDPPWRGCLRLVQPRH
ncbi:MAG: C39 family peptidase [Anaerolineae bacterium]